MSRHHMVSRQGPIVTVAIAPGNWQALAPGYRGIVPLAILIASIVLSLAAVRLG